MEIELKITLDSGKIVILPEEEAKDLYWKLNGLYGNKTEITYTPYIPYEPIITYYSTRLDDPDINKLTIMCSSDRMAP